MVEKFSVRHGGSRIPLVPSSRTAHIHSSMTEQFHKATMIPRPEKRTKVAECPERPNFPLDDLPPGIVLGILRELAKTNVKDPVRAGAVSKNCHEAFCALVASDARFRETLNIFRGDYDHFGSSSTKHKSKARHRYKLRRLGTLQLHHW